MKKNNQLLKFDYNIVLRRISKSTGQILEEEKIHNIVVNNGLNLVRDFLGDVGPDAPKYIAIGEGPTSETENNTSLQTESRRELAAIDVSQDYKVEYFKRFEFGSGESYNITEVGLFDKAIASGSTMFNRATSAAKPVDEDTSLEVTITVTIGRASE
jgi:hypothetical protein